MLRLQKSDRKSLLSFSALYSWSSHIKRVTTTTQNMINESIN